jgi:lactoylglutathione lyase
VDSATAQALADGYIAYSTIGDRSVLQTFSADFYDNVSRTRGLGIFDVVATWLDESFADRSADLHLVTHSGDTVVVWLTAYGRHVGNGFPRLRGLPVKGNRVAWPQVHIFRLDEGMVVEHWAVRDDAAMLDAIKA